MSISVQKNTFYWTFSALLDGDKFLCVFYQWERQRQSIWDLSLTPLPLRFSWCECSKIPAADRGGSSDDRYFPGLGPSVQVFPCRVYIDLADVLLIWGLRMVSWWPSLSLIRWTEPAVVTFSPRFNSAVSGDSSKTRGPRVKHVRYCFSTARTDKSKCLDFQNNYGGPANQT